MNENITLIKILNAALSTIDNNNNTSKTDIQVENNMNIDIEKKEIDNKMDVNNFWVFYVKDLRNDYNLLDSLNQ